MCASFLLGSMVSICLRGSINFTGNTKCASLVFHCSEKKNKFENQKSTSNLSFKSSVTALCFYLSNQSILKITIWKIPVGTIPLFTSSIRSIYVPYFELVKHILNCYMYLENWFLSLYNDLHFPLLALCLKFYFVWCESLSFCVLPPVSMDCIFYSSAIVLMWFLHDFYTSPS